jgi:hypothetical protein
MTYWKTNTSKPRRTRGSTRNGGEIMNWSAGSELMKKMRECSNLGLELRDTRCNDKRLCLMLWWKDGRTISSRWLGIASRWIERGMQNSKLNWVIAYLDWLMFIMLMKAQVDLSWCWGKELLWWWDPVVEGWRKKLCWREGGSGRKWEKRAPYIDEADRQFSLNCGRPCGCCCRWIIWSAS